MSQLSDLELVAQAMAPTTSKPPERATTTSESTGTAQKPIANGHSNPSANGIPDDATSLADIDLSKLSSQDRELLQPLIDALKVSDPNEAGDGDVPIEDILKQLDAAEGVADDLEGKLDRLIAALGREEEVIEGALEKGMKDIS